jgi:hypothetical protein
MLCCVTFAKRHLLNIYKIDFRTNSLIENVICVDEVEVKYWEEGAFSKGYHKESVKITNPGSEDFEYMVIGRLKPIYVSK